VDDPSSVAKRWEIRGVAGGEFHPLSIVGDECGTSGDEVTEFGVHDCAAELSGSRFPGAGLDQGIGRNEAVAF
jgi:hypothetical protein